MAMPDTRTALVAPANMGAWTVQVLYRTVHRLLGVNHALGHKIEALLLVTVQSGLDEKLEKIMIVPHVVLLREMYVARPTGTHSTPRPTGIIVTIEITIAISETTGVENLRANELIAGAPNRYRTRLLMVATDSMRAQALWPMTLLLIEETLLVITASAISLLRVYPAMLAPPRALILNEQQL